MKELVQGTAPSFLAKSRTRFLSDFRGALEEFYASAGANCAKEQKATVAFGRSYSCPKLQTKEKVKRCLAKLYQKNGEREKGRVSCIEWILVDRGGSWFWEVMQGFLST